MLIRWMVIAYLLSGMDDPPSTSLRMIFWGPPDLPRLALLGGTTETWRHSGMEEATPFATMGNHGKTI